MSKKQRNEDEGGVEVLTETPKPTIISATVKPRLVKPKEPQKVITLADRKFPLDGFVRGKAGLGQAFAAEMRIKDQGKVVKRIRAEWTGLYEAFLKAPRG